MGYICNILIFCSKIYAVEQHGERFKTLNEMVAKMDCFCVETINADSLQLDETRCPDVEYILVDPSCSGSGTILSHKFVFPIFPVFPILIIEL